MVQTWIRAGICGTALLLMGAGCTIPSIGLSPVSPTSTPTVPSTVIGWSTRGPGVERLQTSFSTSTASDLILYRFAIAEHSFGFVHTTSAAALSEWSKRSPETVFLSNGVYFHEDQLPSGWLKIQGQVIGKRAFDRDKSALLELAPKADIVTDTAEIGKRMFYAEEAAQSFPLLISHGASSVKEDSGRTARRTFIGIDKDHEFLYVGIVPYAGISLFELSRVLAELPVHWDAVLNLDGGPSSGLVFHDARQSEQIDSYVTVPNVFVVRRKAR